MEIFIMLVILGTSIWVYFDARALGVRKGLVTGLGNMGPWPWFFVCLLLWIIGFPAYIAMRGKYKAANRQSV